MRSISEPVYNIVVVVKEGEVVEGGVETDTADMKNEDCIASICLSYFKVHSLEFSVKKRLTNPDYKNVG